MRTEKLEDLLAQATKRERTYLKIKALAKENEKLFLIAFQQTRNTKQCGIG